MYKNEFTQARDILNEIERLEKGFKRGESKKEWNESWTEYRCRMRRESKADILMTKVPSKVCPLCEKVETRSGLWVLIGARQLKNIELLHDEGWLNNRIFNLLLKSNACCKSCFARHCIRRNRKLR